MGGGQAFGSRVAQLGTVYASDTERPGLFRNERGMLAQVLGTLHEM
jgi:hypothetical protein